MKLLIYALFLIPQVTLASVTQKKLTQERPPFKLPDLMYSYDSLTPEIDKETMMIHHTKHHQAYIDNANKLLADSKNSILEIFNSMESYPIGVKNNLGGHFNHAFFWSILTPEAKNNKISLKLKKAIEKQFGSFERFQNEFESAGLSRFGSGWVWLIKMPDQNLRIITSPNQDSPLMSTFETKGKPILAIDLWEHAYYLNYQYKRTEYLKNLWKRINWTQVQKFWEEK